ncbi:MAG: Cof-type HAD-IIB family hydrolase [Oscillospiraceae bacterium]|jgi:Cof subfamily protein (haloacid dehalogenase superfamily)|nr:Cof-type HAD-IIB family hydrolase [Oscillospiraceae bacterium]
MNTKRIKLIVTDLDNTLLRRDKTISGYTVDVFRRVRERGIMAAFATARDFRFVTEHISPRFGIVPDIVIADNGALARYNGGDLYKRLMPAEIANILIPRFDLVRCVSTENAYFLSGEYANDHWSIGKKATVITDFLNGIEDDALYLDGNAGKSSAAITAGFHEVRAVKYSDINLTTVVHREATKLNALMAVEHALNITADEIAAFGDDYSDIDLLSHSGHSVAVANAIDEVKAVADYICGDCDEDGVAKWLEENVLLR